MILQIKYHIRFKIIYIEFSLFFSSVVLDSLTSSFVVLFSALLKLSKVEERFATALLSGLFILLILFANCANASATAEEAPGMAGAVAGIS